MNQVSCHHLVACRLLQDGCGDPPCDIAPQSWQQESAAEAQKQVQRGGSHGRLGRNNVKSFEGLDAVDDGLEREPEDQHEAADAEAVEVKWVCCFSHVVTSLSV